MVVAGDSERFDTCGNQKIYQNRFYLSLTGLKIVTGDVNFVTLSEFDDSRYEGVLRTTVDEGRPFENRSDRKERRRRNFGMIFF